MKRDIWEDLEEWKGRERYCNKIQKKKTLPLSHKKSSKKGQKEDSNNKSFRTQEHTGMVNFCLLTTTFNERD